MSRSPLVPVAFATVMQDAVALSLRSGSRLSGSLKQPSIDATHGRVTPWGEVRPGDIRLSAGSHFHQYNTADLCYVSSVMPSASTNQVLDATQQWLRPLIHVLLRCGITWREFAEL